MTAVRRVLRAQLARRTGPVLLLALVVAVIVGVVVAGVGGARRTASVVDRLDDRTNATDVLVQAFSSTLATEPDIDVRLARALEQVEGVQSASVSLGFPIDAVTDNYFMVSSSPDGSQFDDVDRPILRAGRLPDPDAPDEVAVNQAAIDVLDLQIGDTVSGPTLAQADAITIFDTEAEQESETFPGFVGEDVTVTVVGIIDTPSQLAERKGSIGPQGLASPAFVAAHGQDIGSYGTSIAVTTDDTSPAQLRRLAEVTREAVRGYEPGDRKEYEVNVMTSDSQWRDPLRDTARTVAIIVLVVALFAAAVGVLVALQWVSREVQLSAGDGDVLDALGMTRAERALTAAGPSLVALAIGTVVGIGAAIALSGRFPIGAVRPVEVDPGIRIDPLAIGAGVVVALLLAGATLLDARRRARSVARSDDRRRVAPSRFARLGLAAPEAIGVDLALDGRRAGRGVPARSAVAGAIVAVLGVTAIVVITSAATTVVDDPARYGWTWTSTPDLLVASEEEANTVAEATLSDPRVAGGADLGYSQVSIDGQLHPAMSLTLFAGEVPLPMTDGRPPVSTDEVAVSKAFARSHHLDVGDSLTLDDPSGGDPQTLMVVGTLIGPPIDDQPREILLSQEGLFAFAQTEPASYAAIRYVPGTDRAELEADLIPMGWRFTDSSEPQAPSQVEQFRTARNLLIGALVLVAALGGAGIVHVLATSARRRSRDLAVLRSLGFLRRDVRTVLTSQAVTATAVGVVVGIPLGIAAGRALWSLTVSRLGIDDHVGLPWLQLLVIAVVALLGAVVVSIPIGVAASRRPIAATLRAE